MSLVKNSMWNLGGYVIPSLIIIPSLGYLARTLGAELFGIYTIAIAIVGYASIFDVGISRAIIREIAIFRDDTLERNKIISTATVFIAVFSTVSVVLLYFFMDGLVSLLKVSPEYFYEVNSALKLLLLSIPLFLINQLWLAVLEGDEKFANLNVQRTISSSLIAGLPSAFVIYHQTLYYAVIGLVVARVFSFVITYIVIKKEKIILGFTFYKHTFKRLIMFGGWITVSNIISPIMVYFDRFIVSNVIGAGAVAYYTIPSEGVSRLGILPAALSRAIFPKLSNLKKTNDIKEQIRLSYKLASLTCLPVIILGMFFSNQIIYYWMGNQYVAKCAPVFCILLIGFFFNSIAQIPFATIQAAGKAKTTALLHCFEIIPYLVFLYYCINRFGIMGAAYAWSIRMFVDCLLLIFLSLKVYSSKQDDVCMM